MRKIKEKFLHDEEMISLYPQKSLFISLFEGCILKWLNVCMT